MNLVRFSFNHSPANSLIEFTLFFVTFQLERFRSLEDPEGNTLSHNFREVQSIGDRIVWFTSDTFSHDDDDLHSAIHGKKKKAKNAAEKSHGTFIMSLLLSIVNFVHHLMTIKLRELY